MSFSLSRSTRVLALGLVPAVISLAILGKLTLGAHAGLPPALTAGGMVWLGSVGLPSLVGVGLAAMAWGHTDAMTGLGGFLVLAAALALGLQIAAGMVVAKAAATARALGRLGSWRQAVPAVIGVAALACIVLRFTHSPVVTPPVIVDGHAHLFGDGGWPPIHQQTCGLSPAQKANVSYRALTRLLQLPTTGDVDELYVQALVRQARDARQKLGAFRVVLLAQDCRYTATGEPDWTQSSVYVPNTRLFQVVSNHPDLFLPCPSLNPQRKDWLRELHYCLAQGARVLKVHPPTQAVDPSDPKFREFYRHCARNGMTIMVHTGSEHSAPISSPTLGDPRLLQLALDEGCTVIAAHAGTRAFFDPPDEDHFGHLVELMARYPRLYADTAVLGSIFRWRCVPQIVDSPAALPRILHASDWPFPANPIVFWNRLHPFTLIELAAETNLFVRDARLKLALGMPGSTFAQIQDILSSERATPTGGPPTSPLTTQP